MGEYSEAHATLAPASGWQAQTKCVRFREFCVFRVRLFYQTAIYFFEHEFLELPDFLLTKVSPCGLHFSFVTLTQRRKETLSFFEHEPKGAPIYLTVYTLLQCTLVSLVSPKKNVCFQEHQQMSGHTLQGATIGHPGNKRQARNELDVKNKHKKSGASCFFVSLKMYLCILFLKQQQ